MFSPTLSPLQRLLGWSVLLVLGYNALQLPAQMLQARDTNIRHQQYELEQRQEFVNRFYELNGYQ